MSKKGKKENNGRGKVMKFLASFGAGILCGVLLI